MACTANFNDTIKENLTSKLESDCSIFSFHQNWINRLDRNLDKFNRVERKMYKANIYGNKKELDKQSEELDVMFRISKIYALADRYMCKNPCATGQQVLDYVNYDCWRSKEWCIENEVIRFKDAQ